MKIILLVNDAPELVEQFIQLGSVFGYTQSDIHVINHISRDIQRNQFIKMMSNYSGCTSCSNDLSVVVANQTDEVLILDDDYFFKTTGTTEYLDGLLATYPDGVGLIEDNQIKILYIHKDNFVENSYESVHNPEDLMDYFNSNKVLNRNRVIPV